MSRPFQDSRRRLLAGGAGAAMAAATGLAGASRGNGRNASSKRRVTLGFIPLTDCAPLAIAAERGFFAAEGLEVRLSREPSWAAIRDKVAIGALDGAHMLAGMPLATSLGASGTPQPMITALSLNLNGNAITVSAELYQRMLAADPEAMASRPVSARALKRVIEADQAEGLAPLTFASVYPVSSHNYQLRYWLAAGGIDPERDVRLIVIDPPRMVANLAAGRIAGYCVGEPWNQLAVARGVGHAVITGYELWNNAPEKVFGVTRDWADTNPDTHRALLRALITACAWLDVPGNRAEAAQILAGPAYVDADPALLRRALSGGFQYHPGSQPEALPDFNVFHRYAANFPWRSHAAWFITQMLRWGQIRHAVDIRRAAAEVYRPDIYRAVAGELNMPAPAADDRPAGGHAQSWTLTTNDGALAMGPDRFIDGRVFDPDRPVAYLESFERHALSAALADLRRLNPETHA
ncbi:CmpA/NrtA family ABC transporter substrate-binding protein [Spectribacter hydrogenooxidans]|uniref:ABC transporter substrate-binding protein n=1 Tax=Spectribacter hydrogenoxidans TaxID=3075608 RepID=A0ABU3BWJ7_9GAMM|nr:ABC transporter substrate-binding protein [Salinisphaera sp. W335]MDT0633673.1 ABC transporter substrate-binding protein [Salinisphaera sp. W335]